MRRSAGLLLHRRGPDGWQVLIGHMGGPLWVRREAGAWTVPKGEYTDEDPHDAAVREFTEEVGVPPPDGPEVSLGDVRQAGGKCVTAWARRADLDLEQVRPGRTTVEWPRGSGRRLEIPELDRVAWVGLGEARRLVVAAQVELLDRLELALGEQAPGGASA
jgi:predicted NUDIX family NTP pyrophosphohydrolase